MSATPVKDVYTHSSPGEFRAVALNTDGQAFRLFLQRWSGEGEGARYGTVSAARLTAFVDTLRGAFCELASGEEAFLRLRSREGLSEGQALTVRVESEARSDKLARVTRTDIEETSITAFERWCQALGYRTPETSEDSSDTVAAAFEEAQRGSVVLKGGGKLHIERTRAITAMDIDTAGRTDKGSAGARALTLNRIAVSEAIRQIGLRGLGGLCVLDCVSPLNAEAGVQIRDTGRQALETFGLSGAKILKPSPLGLVELSLPWRYRPLEDTLSADERETRLLDLLRDVQREATAQSSKFFHLALCSDVWSAYLSRKTFADQAVQEQFSGRVRVVESLNGRNEVFSP